ncbi:hypothetical protein KBB96_09100 [Luteolibacter ambystomatis]|uniref:Uncharacterized protein n=1 Tax=Luteolibacter ambystomatis TaxID=2824561 RepID=A0A975PGS5_9BACT|nr:hypothetical protein [Luteolibacter ambystomatis]QUE53034.1 hypothetical protein KBB96_09100 [Luteolibacter ambystomatis]
MKSVAAAAALLIAPWLMAEPASPDVQARFLAGQTVTGSSLEPLCGEAAWQQHAREFTKAWQDVDKRQLAKIADWMPRVAPYAYEDSATLFYLFSGPDFLYSHAYFPNAATTVMCGIEPVGSLPDVAALTPEQRAGSLQNLRKSISDSLDFSFFRTKAMKEDLQNTALNGTTPVLYLFLAHAGCRITTAEKVWVDGTGEIQTQQSPQAKTPGVKIAYVAPNGRNQTVYYFSSDLSNEGIRTSPGFIAFCNKQGVGNGFAKAASYLMHMAEFSKARDFLLTHTKTMIQDDSGIPYRFFKDAGWNVVTAGHYLPPIDLFKERYQADLHEAFKEQPVIELPFSAGYRWRPNESALLIARMPQDHEVPKAVRAPVPDAPPAPAPAPVPPAPTVPKAVPVEG